MRSVFFLLLVGLLLAGCSSTPTPLPMQTESWEAHRQQVSRMTDWSLRGKIGIRTPSNSQSASLNWIQTGQQYQIDIRGPWGQGGASIYGEPGAVTIDAADEGIFRGESPDQLLEEHLGWQLPLSHFYWWIRGLPSPDESSDILLENNRLSQLKQDGWEVQFLAYNDTQPILPRKIKLRYYELSIIIVIHDWEQDGEV